MRIPSVSVCLHSPIPPHPFLCILYVSIFLHFCLPWIPPEIWCWMGGIDGLTYLVVVRYNDGLRTAVTSEGDRQGSEVRRRGGIRHQPPTPQTPLYTRQIYGKGWGGKLATGQPQYDLLCAFHYGLSVTWCNQCCLSGAVYSSGWDMGRRSAHSCATRRKAFFSWFADISPRTAEMQGCFVGPGKAAHLTEKEVWWCCMGLVSVIYLISWWLYDFLTWRVIKLA